LLLGPVDPPAAFRAGGKFIEIMIFELICVLFFVRKGVLPEGLAKEFAKMLKIPKSVDSIGYKWF